ncbi:restriction endonuclease subunit S [Streptomyces sp. NPDC088557]|uniref:restriction endonuclease subunit S n=1 Tax=Streptomyces sp. NPDC088557 TaxID=3365867 RepID=UPI00380C8E2C
MVPTSLGWAQTVPGHWKVVPLNFVATMGTGHTPDRGKKEYWENCAIPWVTTPDVTRRGDVLTPLMETEQKISELGMANSAAVLHPTDTVMLSRTASIGYSVRIGRPMATTQAFVTWHAGPELDPRYLLLVLRAMKQEWRKLAYGSTHLTIYMPDLESIRIPLPPLEEQRRIADFLEAETARIDRLQRLRARHRALLVERTRRYIEGLAIGRGLPSSPSGNQWIREIPDGWSILPLKRRWCVVDCKHRTPKYVDDGYPVVSPGDVTPGRLDLSAAHRFVAEADFFDLADDLRRPRRGDIIYSRNATVGIAAYVDTDAPFTMGQDVCRITSPDQDQLFLTHVLNTVSLAELQSLQVGSTFARVNIGTLLQLSIPCPPPREQAAIARQMDEATRAGAAIDRQIERQLTVLAERRQALITAAVTGQFDVSTASGRNVTEGITA